MIIDIIIIYQYSHFDKGIWYSKLLYTSLTCITVALTFAISIAIVCIKRKLHLTRKNLKNKAIKHKHQNKRQRQPNDQIEMQSLQEARNHPDSHEYEDTIWSAPATDNGDNFMRRTDYTSMVVDPYAYNVLYLDGDVHQADVESTESPLRHQNKCLSRGIINSFSEPYDDVTSFEGIMNRCLQSYESIQSWPGNRGKFTLYGHSDGNTTRSSLPQFKDGGSRVNDSKVRSVSHVNDYILILPNDETEGTTENGME